MLSPILCAIDLSDCSRHALDVAIELASRLRAKITVLHVVQHPDALLEKQEYIEYLAQQYKVPLTALMQEVHALHPDTVHEQAVVLEGRPAKTIVEYAKEHGYRLIMLGTHGRSGMAHALLGSVAERVIRTSLVPVLTIPPPRSGP